MSKLSDEQEERERLPLSPDEAIQTLTEILALLDSIEGHPPVLSKARVLLRGVIGCGIAPPIDSDSQAAKRYEALAGAVWDKFWSDFTSDRWSVRDIASVLRAADASGDAAVGAGLSSPCEADSISAAAQTAATSMRDKCVEKVKELHDSYEKELRETEDYEYGASLGCAALALEKAASALESLTLDQVEPKQP